MATAAGAALALERAARLLAEGRDALSEAGRDVLASRADVLVEAVEEEIGGPPGAWPEPNLDDGLDGDYDEPYPEPGF